MSDLAQLLSSGHYTFYKSLANSHNPILSETYDLASKGTIKDISEKLRPAKDPTSQVMALSQPLEPIKGYIQKIEEIASSLRNNELSYINQILQKNSKLLSPHFKNKLLKLQTSDGISAADYNDLIVILNKIHYNGKESVNSFSRIINDQINNITNLQANMNKLKEAGPQGIQTYKDLQNEYIYRYNNYIMDYNKRLEEIFDKEYKRKRRTLVQTWAAKINDVMNILIRSSNKKIKELVEQLWQSHPEEKQIIINGYEDAGTFMILIDEIIQRVMDSNDTAVNISNSIMEDLRNGKIKLPAEIKGTKVANINTTDYLIDDDLLEESDNLITRLLLESQNTEEILNTLFPEPTAEITNLLNQLKSFKASLQDKTISPQTYKTKIKKLKTNGKNTNFTEDLKQAIEDRLKVIKSLTNTDNYTERLKSFILKNISLRLDKSGLAELVASDRAESQIINAISNKAPGTEIKLKDDVFCIVTVDQLYELDKAIFDSKEETTLKSFLASMQQEVKQAFSDFVKEYAKMEYVNKDGTNKRFNETNVAAAHSLYLQKIQKIAEQYEEIQKKNPTLFKEIQEYVENHSTFLESISVKEYDLYNDEIGFHAGTLGANVSKVLSNIEEMYRAGGLSPIDAKTLELAVLNCSSAAIGGDPLRQSLEAYLLGGAALMIFDEGLGNNLQVILTNMDATIQKLLPKNLNLYFLNGAYIPASYILQTIAENLHMFYTSELNDNIDQIFHQNKVIINDVGEIKIKYSDNLPNDFFELSKQVLENTKIQFVFMAGMLDIFKNLSKAFRPRK